jgi:hypothetical protein
MRPVTVEFLHSGDLLCLTFIKMAWSRCFIGWGIRYVDQLEQELLRYRRTRPGDTIEHLCEIFEHHKSYLLERWGREGTAR